MGHHPVICRVSIQLRSCIHLTAQFIQTMVSTLALIQPHLLIPAAADPVARLHWVNQDFAKQLETSKEAYKVMQTKNTELHCYPGFSEPKTMVT